MDRVCSSEEAHHVMDGKPVLDRAAKYVALQHVLQPTPYVPVTARGL